MYLRVIFQGPQVEKAVTSSLAFAEFTRSFATAALNDSINLH